MKQHRLAFAAAVSAAALTLSLVSGCAVAQDAYGYGYDMSRHPNIEAADANAQQAIERMRAAQRANDGHMGGHAGRAIALLQEARAEMQYSAAAATR